MHLFTRNVNTAFYTLVKGIHNGEIPTIKRDSRNGPVRMIEEPVTITYSHPTERVLFNTARDCNPFFHLYESLWMLAGRDDVASLAYYSSKIKEFSDDGNRFNGAYGDRWRNGGYIENGIDQLDIIVNHLKANPTSRRAVLQMWNVEDDLLKIEDHPDRSGNLYNPDLKFPASKDVCCNLSVMFSIREEEWSKAYTSMGVTASHRAVLDMTVTNRSNDLIWGMLGANVVHFSFLQEYVAARLGVVVGKYNHFTNNLHAYDWNWKPEEWLKADEDQLFGFHVSNQDDWGARYKGWTTVPLAKDIDTFDEELHDFVEHWGQGKGQKPDYQLWFSDFLFKVANPMMMAFSHHKQRDYSKAREWCRLIVADDWRVACTNWIKRRQGNADFKERTDHAQT